MDKEVKLIFPSYVDTPFLHYILLWGSKSHIKVSCSRIFKIKLSRHFLPPYEYVALSKVQMVVREYRSFCMEA